ncbi:hypothetical protein ACYFX5_08960 [Bremerella sp. T1]|uniref:hypothetical protein n=1 Tax=Bremerella sp. TYQ1 TaxID=3119568 RepID=UPI001CCA7469|nr:hypothetical protein [Bremerella volcania]UBM38383.1 hypothetical protein LA756_10890 [Bremerella volcania]
MYEFLVDIIIPLVAGIAVPFISVYYAAKFANVDAWKREAREQLVLIAEHVDKLIVETVEFRSWWLSQDINQFDTSERMHFEDEQLSRRSRRSSKLRQISNDMLTVKLLFGLPGIPLYEQLAALSKYVNDSERRHRKDFEGETKELPLKVFGEIEKLGDFVAHRSIFSDVHPGTPPPTLLPPNEEDKPLEDNPPNSTTT